jgi:hypothetical protein
MLRIFVPRRHELAGGLGKQHNEEICGTHSWSCTVMKSDIFMDILFMKLAMLRVLIQFQQIFNVTILCPLRVKHSSFPINKYFNNQ